MPFVSKSLFIPSLALLTALPSLAQEPSRLVIVDANGDRGVLAPFLHQQRGPGYLYTTYIFDSLIDQSVTGELAPGLAKG